MPCTVKLVRYRTKGSVNIYRASPHVNGGIYGECHIFQKEGDIKRFPFILEVEIIYKWRIQGSRGVGNLLFDMKLRQEYERRHKFLHQNSTFPTWHKYWPIPKLLITCKYSWIAYLLIWGFRLVVYLTRHKKSISKLYLFYKHLAWHQEILLDQTVKIYSIISTVFPFIKFSCF